MRSCLAFRAYKTYGKKYIEVVEFPEKIEVVEMQPHKSYNIKQGTWHNHTLDENSPIVKMTDKMINEMIDL